MTSEKLIEKFEAAEKKHLAVLGLAIEEAQAEAETAKQVADLAFALNYMENFAKSIEAQKMCRRQREIVVGMAGYDKEDGEFDLSFRHEFYKYWEL